MSPARTAAGARCLASIMRFGAFGMTMRSATSFRFRTMSVTSSRTPAIEENSWSDAVDLDGGDGRALQRGQEHATQRVAQRHAEATLQRLRDHELGDALRRPDHAPTTSDGSVGCDQVLPVLRVFTSMSGGRSPTALDHFEYAARPKSVERQYVQTRRRFGGRQPLCGIGGHVADRW